jgi:hypothetical protein
MNFKKSSTNCRPSVAFLLSTVIAMTLLTGCGGGSENYSGNSVGTEYSQTSGTADQQSYYGTANYPAAASTGSLASSFTLNPTENFQGFNPEIWNDHKSWYECNCGNNQLASPKTMPWNTAG